jgi:UDP-GlcNAc:undecaprenyl-phosphate GlcNAc-1-phosphate transferase
VVGHAHGAWTVWFPLLVFSPFIVDATVTLLRRAARREPIWRAHRSHAYQRLVLAGWGHRKLLLAMQALMLAASASALLTLKAGPEARCAIISAWLVLYLLLLLAVERRARRQGATA